MKNGRTYSRLVTILAGCHFVAVFLSFAGLSAAMALLGTYHDGPNVVADICFFILFTLLFPSGLLIQSDIGMLLAPVHSLVFGLITAGLILHWRKR